MSRSVLCISVKLVCKSHIDKVTEREGRLSRYRKYVWDVIRSSCIFKAGEGAPPLRITRCRPSDS